MNQKSQDNDLILAKFLISKRLQGFREQTEKKYEATIRNFLAYCNKAIKDILSKDVKSWLDENYSKSTENTILQMITRLESFFRYCLENGFIEKLPIKKSFKPSRPEKEPNALNYHEIAILKITAEEELSLRNRAIVEIYYSTGARLSEVYRLNVGDINMEKRLARIIGKNNIERYIPFSHNCKYLLEQIIADRPDSDPLFYHIRNGITTRLGKCAIHNVFKRLESKTGIKLHCHRYRYSYGKKLFLEGESLETIKKHLGHRNVRVTRKHYVGKDYLRLRQVYLKCMGGF